MSYFLDLSREHGGVYVIAEACDNHMGSLEVARALARAAKKSGADAVKFQHHIADEEMLREAQMSSNFDEHLFDFLERNALSIEDHHKLKKFCDDIGITYLCTPFSFKAAKEILDLVPFFKVGSGEFFDHWFIDKLIEFGKPILFSSGMCSDDEVQQNLKYYSQIGFEFAIMNCLSEYPPVLQDMNLGYITNLIKRNPDLVVGHSDHTGDIFTSISAVTLGARIVEKHLTLSNFIHGPDKDVSLTPEQFEKLVDCVKSVCETLGTEKKLHDGEKSVRGWAYRSVISRQSLKPGDVLDEHMICTKRPGTGIPSSYYKSLYGKKITRDIKPNTMLSWEDVSDE